MAPPSRAFSISEWSGGSAPLLAARAAVSLGKGERKWSDGSAGRVVGSPDSFGGPGTWMPAANAFTCSAVRPMPSRLR